MKERFLGSVWRVNGWSSVVLSIDAQLSVESGFSFLKGYVSQSSIYAVLILYCSAVSLFLCSEFYNDERSHIGRS